MNNKDFLNWKIKMIIRKQIFKRIKTHIKKCKEWRGYEEKEVNWEWKMNDRKRTMDQI